MKLAFLCQRRWGGTSTMITSIRFVRVQKRHVLFLGMYAGRRYRHRDGFIRFWFGNILLWLRFGTTDQWYFCLSSMAWTLVVFFEWIWYGFVDVFDIVSKRLQHLWCNDGQWLDKAPKIKTVKFIRWGAFLTQTYGTDWWWANSGWWSHDWLTCGGIDRCNVCMFHVA